MKNYRSTLLLGLAMLANVGAGAQALQQVNADGKLLGATGILVGSSYYDVVFKTGTCNSLIAGCGGGSFVFGSHNVTAAAQALRDQVFTGAFDTQPSMTLGCDPAKAYCQLMTPYQINPRNTTFFNYSAFYNSALESEDFTTSLTSSFGRAVDTTSSPYSAVFAVWSPSSPNVLPPVSAVPEAQTYALLLAGLGVVGAMVRRRKAVQGH